MNAQDTLAQAIISAHRHLALATDAPSVVQFSRNSEAYRAAKQAACALGFIEPDAECVAKAWDAQSERTGEINPMHWPDKAVNFGLRPWPRDDAFAACPHQLGLYAVLPDAAWVGRMARVVVPTVQLRFKSDNAEEIKKEVSAAVEAVKGTQALLFINDHWQAAMDAGAYGVHLGQEDMDIANLNAIKAAGLRLGLSSHGYAEMVRADQVSPSYIAMGAVFATTLKRMVTPPQGAGRLHAYARLMQDYPLVAIGGIDPGRMNDVLASGVGSVAVVRALVTAAQPEEVASALQAVIRQGTQSTSTTSA
jgi:thiamine-phosphate pyrophosphorylase